jgi:hypothetical protein
MSFSLMNRSLSEPRDCEAGRAAPSGGRCWLTVHRMQPYSHLYFPCYSRLNGEQQPEGLETMANTLIVLYKAKAPDKNRRRFDEIAPQPQCSGGGRLEPQLALEKAYAFSGSASGGTRMR